MVKKVAGVQVHSIGDSRMVNTQGRTGKVRLVLTRLRGQRPAPPALDDPPPPPSTDRLIPCVRGQVLQAKARPAPSAAPLRASAPTDSHAIARTATSPGFVTPASKTAPPRAPGDRDRDRRPPHPPWDRHPYDPRPYRLPSMLPIPRAANTTETSTRVISRLAFPATPSLLAHLPFPVTLPLPVLTKSSSQTQTARPSISHPRVLPCPGTFVQTERALNPGIVTNGRGTTTSIGARVRLHQVQAEQAVEAATTQVSQARSILPRA